MIFKGGGIKFLRPPDILGGRWTWSNAVFSDFNPKILEWFQEWINTNEQGFFSQPDRLDIKTYNQHL